MKEIDDKALDALVAELKHKSAMYTGTFEIKVADALTARHARVKELEDALDGAEMIISSQKTVEKRLERQLKAARQVTREQKRALCRYIAKLSGGFSINDDPIGDPGLRIATNILEILNLEIVGEAPKAEGREVTLKKCGCAQSRLTGTWACEKYGGMRLHRCTITEGGDND